MYYDVYTKNGRHWQPQGKKPTHNHVLAIAKLNVYKKRGLPVVLIISNTDTRHKDRGLRMVVAMMKAKDEQRSSRTATRTGR